MKNFKQIAFGLMVGLMAIGFSAFTNAHTVKYTKVSKALKAGLIVDNFIVQPTTDNFVEQSTVATSNCHSTATRECIYDVTSSGKSNIPDQPSYSADDIDGYVSNGWLANHSGSTNALY